MTYRKVCLITPPNQGILGGTGYIRDAEGKRKEVPLFPIQEGMEVVATRGRRQRGIVPPLGILYVASQLEKAGHEVVLLDFQAGRFDCWELEQAVDEADIIGITTVTDSLNSVQFICHLIRTQRPDIPIVIGGPDATVNPDHYRDLCTVVFQGESEGRVEAVFERPHYEKKLAGWPSVQPPFESCPYPARHLVTQSNYRYLGVKAGSCIGSRGCPHSCSYCARGGLLCYSYRRRQPSQVLDELEQMASEGYRFVSFNDSNFTGHEGHAEAIWQGIIDRKIKMLFSASLSVHNASAKMYKLARAAGFVGFSFGFESGNNSTLQSFGKHATVEDNTNAVRWACDAGIFVKGNFILGDLSENLEATYRTIAWACTQPIDNALFSILTYVKGSRLWDWAVADGRIQPEETSIRASKERRLSQLTEDELNTAYKAAVLHFKLSAYRWQSIEKLSRRQNHCLWPMVMKAGCARLRPVF